MITFDMPMKTAFENYLRDNTQLTEDEIKHISGLSIERKLRRNQLLLEAGDVSRHKVFIMSGMLRNYGIKEDGSEHILQFSPELTWTLDVESYDTEQPAKYNIGALEPSDVLLWSKADFTRLLDELPALKQLSQQLISRNIYLSRQRLVTVLGSTPEEKYEDFLREFPHLLQRLPLRMIASYLGISLKTLNRVRHAQLVRS
jgi:CRP/FNR family transcriptional regulator, anaerobic regulatory protein